METLGEGGFGVVYRAEPLIPGGGLQNQVVIKLIRDRSLPEETVHRLRGEARTLKHLNHPAVIGVEDIVPFERGWGVISEYISGVYLSELIEREALTVQVALELVEGVADALQAAYNAPSPDGRKLGLTHRDLRPANIRITPEGQVKVLDFGGARVEFALPEGEAAVEKSKPYTPPERAQGREGPEGDVYSLGIIFAECLLGEFLGLREEDPDQHDKYVDHLSRRLRRRIYQGNPELPEALGDAVIDVVSSMLAREPEDRPDAREISEACSVLRKEMGGEWIRLWANRHVQQMMAEQDPNRRDDSTGTIFAEALRGLSAEETESTLAQRAGIQVMRSREEVNLGPETEEAGPPGGVAILVAVLALLAVLALAAVVLFGM